MSSVNFKIKRCVFCAPTNCTPAIRSERNYQNHLTNSHKQLANLLKRSVTSPFVGVRVATNLISHFLSSYGCVKIPILTSNGLSWAQGHRWNEISEERIACPQTRRNVHSAPCHANPLPFHHTCSSAFWNHLWLLQRNIHALLWVWDQLTNSFLRKCKLAAEIYVDSKRGVTLIQRPQMGRISLGQNSRWEYSSIYRV